MSKKVIYATLVYEDIEVTPLENEEWKLTKDLQFSVLTDYSGWHRVTIPKGYVMDFASVPRFFWRAFGHPADTETVGGAIVHDFTFTHRPFLGDSRVTFEQSADIYSILIETHGAGWFQRLGHNIAVRSPFARKLWKSHDHEFIEDKNA